jgi:UDP-glucose 4-epimerase
VARLLITGATGLVGRALCARLAAAGYRLRAALRTDGELPEHVCEKVIVGDVARFADWEAALAGVDLVVHAAARTHVREMRQDARAYTETNVTATQRLAAAAATQGVRRFIYLSSIKVNGEESGSCPFEAERAPAPQDAYGRSKLAAELALRSEADRRGMEFAIVRPPLVYGPGVQSNFLRLMSWVDRERFLPFGAVRNRRSLVNVWNLSELVLVLLRHPLAQGRVWLVADEETPSTPELVRHLAAALQRRAHLVDVPVKLLHLAGALTGQSSLIARLCGSLELDCARTHELLDWHPSVSLKEGLARTAAWYRTR